MNWLEWAGVILTPAVIAAIVTGGMNYLNSERQIRANTISKARIEWIKSFRDISTDYVCSTTDYVNHLGIISIQKKRLGDKFDENNYLIETKEYIKSINQSGAKMKLYLPLEISDSNKLNNQIREKMNEIDSAVMKCFNNHNEGNTKEFDKKIEEFVSLVGEYLKTEWNTVKSIK